MKKYHLFLPLLGILLLVSGGCSKRKEPKPLITEALQWKQKSEAI